MGPVFRLTRERLHLSSGQRETDVVYGVTSLTPKEATPARLLYLNRGHWSIENRSHYVRDRAYDEDRQQIRRKNGPRVMATLRNVAISLLRLAGYRNITAALRHLAAHGRLALCRLGLRGGTPDAYAKATSRRSERVGPRVGSARHRSAHPLTPGPRPPVSLPPLNTSPLGLSPIPIQNQPPLPPNRPL